MKSMKIYPIKKPIYAILCAVLLAGSAVSCQDAKPNSASVNQQTGTEIPDMDLQAAVFSGNLEVVKQHIEAGSNLDVKDPMSGSTPLIIATIFGKTEIASALIDAGADLTIKNNDGATPLHVAAFFCRVETTQDLLDAGAEKNVRNNFGATPRETVMGSFADVKPIYDLMQTQLGPLGLKLDMAELEKTRPVITMMLQ